MIYTASLIAQLVIPNTQPGPVRLPGTGALENLPAKIEIDTQDIDNNSKEAEDERSNQDRHEGDASTSGNPILIGNQPYEEKELNKIFSPCQQQKDRKKRLQECAAALTTKLLTDGYINSRVFILSNQKNGTLEVIEGRITEIRISGPDESLNNYVLARLEPLKQEALNIYRLDNALAEIRRYRPIGRIQGQLKRLGSQVSETSLIIDIEAREFPWKGLFQASNDGSFGTGELRGIAILSKEKLIKNNDTLLLFSEINGNIDPDFGSFLGSISYRHPLSSTLDITLAGGYSHRRLIDYPNNQSLISYRTKQGTIQFDWNVHRSSNQLWTLFGSMSGDQSRLYINGQSLSKKQTGLSSLERQPRGAYAKIGINGAGAATTLRWGANVYALQGLAASMPEQQRQQRNKQGVDVGQALGVGGQAALEWDATESIMLKAKVSGQQAVQPLLSSMGFILGSDQGLLGLPSQWMSGDSGWLATAELPWTFTEGRQGRFQLVPYLGGGGVKTVRKKGQYVDSIISYGLFIRYQTKEENFQFDVGLTGHSSKQSYEVENTMLNHGLYLSTTYLF